MQSSLPIRVLWPKWYVRPVLLQSYEGEPKACKACIADVSVFQLTAQNQDIRDALSQWTSICGPQGDQANTQCCPKVTWIILKEDCDALWDGGLNDPFKVEITPAWTKLGSINVSSCTFNCPPGDDIDDQGRVNAGITKDHIYLNGGTDYNYFGLASPNYLGIKSALYTGRTLPAAGVGHNLVSLYQIITHECGHYFGLWHSNVNPCCEHDKWMIMNDYADPNQDALSLSCDDMCMFHLLYCPDLPFSCPSGSRAYSPPKKAAGCPTLAKKTGDQIQSHETVCVGDLCVNMQRFGWKSIMFSVFPNPTSSGCMITFSIPEMMSVSLSIFDVSGRNVKSWPTTIQQSGSKRFETSFSDVGPGTYYCRLQLGGLVFTQKIVYQK